MNVNKKMSREDFIKSGVIGALGLLVASKSVLHVKAAPSITDNLSGSDGSGVYVGSTAPGNRKLLWIDTSQSGVARYHNGSTWAYVKSVWG